MEQINSTYKILVVKPIFPTNKTYRVMQCRLRKRQSVHTSRSRAPVSQDKHGGQEPNHGAGWKHKHTVSGPTKTTRQVLQTNLQKETQNRDLGQSMDVGKAYGLGQCRAHVSTLEPHHDIQMSHTDSEAQACTSALLYSSSERSLALPALTRLRMPQTYSHCGTEKH